MDLGVIVSTIAASFVSSEGKRKEDEEWRKEVEEGRQEEWRERDNWNGGGATWE